MLQFFHQYLLEAGMTGISVLFSSGDSGDDVGSVGSRQVDYPASDPLATAVGGTSTEIGAHGQIVFQTGWSNSYSDLSNGAWSPAPPGNYSSGSGGGTSQLFAQPSYKKGHVPASISEYFGSTPMRAVPDISMPGDPNTGLRVGETQVFNNGTHYAEYRIGGTSLSSPLLAGVLADAVQYSGGAIGFINPLIYGDEQMPAITDVRPKSGPRRRCVSTLPTSSTHHRASSRGCRRWVCRRPSDAPRLRRRDRRGYAQRRRVPPRVQGCCLTTSTDEPGADVAPGRTVCHVAVCAGG